MKLADLKVGDVYALRHELCPYMLLSTDVYERRTKRMGPAEWSKAEPGKKPRSESRSSFFYPHDDYGLLMLEGPDEQTITGIEPAPILEALISGGIDAANKVIPDKASVILVTSLPSILGPFAAVKAKQAQEKALVMERKQHEVNRYNANVDTLNALAGREVLRHQIASVSWEPTSTLVLAPSDVRLMAERRDEETRRVRILLNAVGRFIGNWAESDDRARTDLWRGLSAAADPVSDLFEARIVDLDHRAAQLPDGGLATKP